MSETRELHQSGEKVRTAGIYRLVERTLESDAGTHVTLQKGDYFPDYQGRATNWYLARVLAERKATSPLLTAWQDDSNQVMLG